MSRFGRLAALGRALVPLLVALVLIVIAFDDDEDEPETSGEEAGRVVALVGFGTACGWFGARFLRPVVLRRASIRLDEDHLAIEHRGLFKRPLKIPRDLVRCAMVDERPAPWRWVRDHRRFQLAGVNEADDARAVPAWTWSRTAGSPLPLISHVGDVPNLAVIFAVPIRLEPVRRWVKLFAFKGPVHIPRRGQNARGFVARVLDPRRAAEELARWTLVRPFTLDDLYRIQPTDDERRAARRKRLRTNALLAGVVLVQGIPALFADDSDTFENGSQFPVHVSERYLTS